MDIWEQLDAAELRIQIRALSDRLLIVEARAAKAEDAIGDEEYRRTIERAMAQCVERAHDLHKAAEMCELLNHAKMVDVGTSSVRLRFPYMDEAARFVHLMEGDLVEEVAAIPATDDPT